MKILHLNTSDIGGGAALGAYNLHRGLLNHGLDSKLLVIQKLSSDPEVIQFVNQNWFVQKLYNQRFRIDDFRLKKYSLERKTLFSVASYTPSNFQKLINELQPDIIHIHWINNGFIVPEDLKSIKIPIVWTIRDMWPFTGGCHYSFGCEKYKSNCGACPQLGSSDIHDISESLISRKLKYFKDLKITAVGISDWITDCAKSSVVFRDFHVSRIYNGVDNSIFYPRNKFSSIEKWGLSKTKPKILFCALNAIKDYRKGFHFLFSLISELSKYQLVVVGSAVENTLGDDILFIPEIKQQSDLAEIYSACDLLCAPTIEEAFGKVIVESMMCGTPVVCFKNTGMKELVQHLVSGYLAEDQNSQDLLLGIKWGLSNSEQLKDICVEKSAKFQVENSVKQYIGIYEQLLDESD